MSKYKIFGNKGESTINILTEVLGADAVKNILPTSDTVKYASVEDSKKELNKLLNSIANSKQVVKYANTKKGSVIDIAPALVKNAEKEFLTDSTNYLYKMCSLYGIKGAQLTAYKTNLSDITLKGLKQNIPHAKAGDIYFNIKSNSLGMGNTGYIKLSMSDSKIIEPKNIYLNKKDKFSFTSEGCQELLKKCHSDKSYDNEDTTGKTFVTLEYQEQPGLGVQGNYRNLGKYSNYFELKSLLKNAGYIVTDKHDINTYEIIPFENTDIKDMLTILKNNGKKSESKIDAAAFIDKKVEGATKKIDKDDLQSTEVKDNKSKSLTDAIGNPKAATTDAVSNGKNKPAKDNTETEEVTNGKTEQEESKEPKETDDKFGKSQNDDEFMNRPDTDGSAKDSGADGDGGAAAKMLQDGENKPAKSNPKGGGGKATTNNGKTSEDTDTKSKETDDNFGDSQTSAEFMSRDHKSKGGKSAGPGDNSKPASASTKKEASGVAGIRPPAGSARDKARLDSSKYDKGVKPETQMKNEFDKDMKSKCSARLAAIAKYKQASSLNKGDELDAERTTKEHLRDDIPDFFSSWHYLDEGADKFNLDRGSVAKYLQSALDRGYRLKVKADGDSEEELSEKYVRSIADVLGKLKVVKNDGKVPDNLNTKESQKKKVTKQSQGISIGTQGPGSMGTGLNNGNPQPGNINPANSGKLPGLDANPTRQNLTMQSKNPKNDPNVAQQMQIQSGELDTKISELTSQGYKNIVPMKNDDGTFTLTYSKK